MWSWFTALALAAAPEGVDLEDLDGWEARSRALLDGPSGCWELSGRATVKFAAYTPGGVLSRAGQHDLLREGTFHGRIEDGVWRSFGYSLETKEGKLDLDVPIYPMEGRIDAAVIQDESPKAEEARGGVSIATEGGGNGTDAGNLLDDVLEDLDFGAALSWVEWRDDLGGLVLIEEVPLEDGRDPPMVRKTTTFPQGKPYGTVVDVLFPPKLKIDEEGTPNVHVMDGQLHLRGVVVGDVVLPGVSGMSVVVGVLGFTGGYEQRMLYQEARRCVTPEAPPPTPP